MNEDRSEVIKEYEGLRKEFNLVKLEEFEKEMGVKISQGYAFGFVMEVLQNRFGSALGFIESIFNPSNFRSMIVSKEYSDEDRNELNKFYYELSARLSSLWKTYYLEIPERAKAFKEGYDWYIKSIKPFMKKQLEKHIGIFEKGPSKEVSSEKYMG